ncbi:MAG: DNA mismatch repair protein MutS [Phycisphaerales bacterium]|jgi:DNA mismatch repair protein MutS
MTAAPPQPTQPGKPKPTAKPAPKPAPKKDPWATPAMQQFVRIKKQHPDCVLFFRMGDFYELFGDDATNVANDLDLKLMHRGNDIPAAGVPYHQRDKYLRLAIAAGYRVAVVDQLEDPKDAKGIVARGVTQVISAGTLIDENLLESESANFLAAVCFDDNEHAGVCLAEASTGAVLVLDGSPERIGDELARRGVREILFAEPSDGTVPERVTHLTDSLRVTPTPRAGWHFRDSEALEAIGEHYRVAGIEGFGLAEGSPSTRALGAILRYMAETQAVGTPTADATSGGEFQRQRATLAHLSPPRLIETDTHCRLDHASLRSLEVEETIRDGLLEGSLLGVFLKSRVGTKCVVRTPMGKRLLREWLTAPLAQAEPIRQRQDAIGALIDDTSLSGTIATELDSIADVARIAGRVALGRTTPRDLVALGASLAAGPGLAEAMSGSASMRAQADELRELSGTLAPLTQAVTASCVDNPPTRINDGGLIREGVDTELDEARALQRDAGAWLVDYQTRLTAEHDLPSLKVGYNRVFGYYIELPANQALRAPDLFTRKQTLKNAERYITPELKAFEDKTQTAEARALQREKVIFDRLCESTRNAVGPISRFAEVIAQLDALAALATKARERGWVRPEITETRELTIHGGRHPVLDELLGHEFVPNDTELASTEHAEPLALITGPNMAGKSTYIRQTALLALLASTGSFIPADRATIGVCDRIFTRVGADDALHRGQSTFMVEMTQAATILNNATPQSLVVLDEIGRGTSTLDGLSLAWAITEFLAQMGSGTESGTGSGDGQPAAGPRTLFATHYHELTDLESRMGGCVRNLHVAVNEFDTEAGRTEIVFLHRIRPGRADRSYGVHVAELAGLPASVVTRASQVLEELSVQHAGGAGRVDPQAVARITTTKPASQLPLFTEYISHPAIDRLREIKLDALTPLEAFDLLRQLADEAKG